MTEIIVKKTIDARRLESFTFAGQVLEPTLEGALYWPEMKALLVADLHLGKGQALVARGQYLPPYDTDATLKMLSVVVHRTEPELVVCLGDNFHTKEQASQLSPKSLNALSGLMAGRDWLWLTGNHDPELPLALGGDMAEATDLGPFHLAHEPFATAKEAVEAGVEALVCGHLHPSARLENGGRRLRRKCFARSKRQLILPAFGSYAGGLNVLDPAFGDMAECLDFQAWLLGREAVYAVGKNRLIKD